jgi:hypothetical protein
VAAGTPCAGQMPVILRSGEVESERGRTVEALAAFIGSSAGSGMGLAWRGAGRAGSGVGRALARSGRVEHVEVCFCPCSKCLLRLQTCESWQKSCADLFLAPRAISCM